MYSHIVAYALCTMMIAVILQTSISHAQITSDTTPSTTLGTIVTPGGTTLNITGGTRPDDGRNLFHSFENFSINADQIANFLNDHNLPTDNILSRVTGSNPSDILGTIKTTDAAQGFSNANFYLMNPQGIMFGPKAKLDVGGSFYATTANNIELIDGQLFNALPENNDATLLTAAPPEAFGFLGENPVEISIAQSVLEVSTVKTLSIVGGNIQVEGGSLVAPNGQVILTSVVTPSQVSITGELTVLTESDRLGEVTMSEGASINTSGADGGTIIIRGGQLTIDGSTILASAFGPDEESAGMASAAETGINLHADSLLIQNNSQIGSDTSGSAKGVNIVFQANENIEVRDRSVIATQASGSKTSGKVTLNAEEDVRVLDGSFVITNAFSGNGNAGNIEVNADKVLLSNSSGAFTGISSQTNQGLTNPSPTTGNSGNIRVKANHLEMVNTTITTAAQSFSTGDAGNIELIIRDGDISLSGGDIISNTLGDGNGGHLQLTSRSLILMNGANIQAASRNTGNAGGATVTLTGDLNLRPGSFIQTRAASTGNAGDLNITAKDIVVRGLSEATDPQESQFTGFTTLTKDGKGGNLTIQADNLQLTDKGFISSGTEDSGIGNAGNISIKLTKTLFVGNGGQVVSNTNGDGNAGAINIKARDVTLTGVNPVPVPRFDGSISPTASAISSQSQGEEINGTAGNIHVIAKHLNLLDGSSIDSQSFGFGNAGSIDLTNMETILLNNSSVDTQAENAFGGNINLEASDLIHLINSEITSLVREGSGNAGNISLDPEFVVIQGSRIDSSTTGLGDGGDIRIIASSAVLVDPLSRLDASSQFGGSGTVDIRAPIQNLGETIAPLPEEILKVSGLFAARCAAQKDGNFSSFVQSGFDGSQSLPGRFLPSPLSFNNFPITKNTQQPGPQLSLLSSQTTFTTEHEIKNSSIWFNCSSS